MDRAPKGGCDLRQLRTLYHLAKADLLERTRSYGFLVTLGLTLYVACFFIPPNHSSYSTMQIGGHRALYNSAYLGALMSLLISPFLSLAGFYLVKNAIDRDIRTGVGQILAATSVSKPLYTVGKALSNFAVLTVLVAIMGLAAAGMQFIRGEDLTFHPGPLIAPLIYVSLPLMAVVGSLAIIFEAIPFLRGGLGNVVYFFLWGAALSSSAARPGVTSHSGFNDLFGVGVLVPSITAACEAAFPGASGTSFSMGINVKSKGQWDLTTFQWNGIEWTNEIIVGRILWLGLALLLALVAAFFFRRFDPARERAKGSSQKRLKGEGSRDEGVPPIPAHAVSLQPLSAKLRFNFLFMVVAELRLALHGISLWWYLVAAGLIAAGLFSPVSVSRGVLVFAWIWPLLIWSGMGTRERRWRTDQVVFSAAYPLWRQLPACWLAGVIIAIVTGGGTGIRLLIAGDQIGLFAWMTGALFIPTMALGFGVWSGSGKLFEVVYLLLWYVGPVNRVAEIDFMGVVGPLLPPRTPMVFFAVTIALAIVAVTGRQRQLSN